MKNKSILFIIIFFILQLSPIPAKAQKETLILLDQSASMYEPFEDSIKFNYAKKAIIKILNNLSDNESIGFRTIGINPSRLRARGFVDNYALCTATDKLNNIMPHSNQNIKMNLDYIIPSGTSPIEYVLNKAIKEDFSQNSDKKQIILVTDGYDNCNGDPCGYIKRLMLNRNDITINIVGIGASDNDFEGLKCLTSASGGNIINIKTPYELENSISYITNKISIPETTYNIENKTIPDNNSKIEYKNYFMEFKE